MSQALNQMQFGNFPAGYFTDLLESDTDTIFGNSPPASRDPLLDFIDPTLLQQGPYDQDQGFESSDLEGITTAGPVRLCTEPLNFTPCNDDDTFASLDASGYEGPAAVCTGIPFPVQGEFSYPPVFDLEEYLASLDKPQLPQHAPVEGSTSDHKETSQDILSLFGSSPPAPQEGGQEDQLPNSFENSSLVLPTKDLLAPSSAFPHSAVILPLLTASPREGFTPGGNGGPSNPTEPSGDQEIVTNFPKRLAATPHLKITGEISAMQRIKDSPEEISVVYSVYEPLKPWAEFKYTTRGHLHEDVVFDEESIQRFVRDHPNGERLILRIEKHPYSFQCRYREPEYIKCRSKVCDWDRTFKVGDHRVAIDEVTGRLAEGQQDDNDPYFSAGYFHLHCFERLIPVAPLVVFNILVPDNRRIYEKEPDCTRINKMGVSPASASAFASWRIEAVQGYSVSGDWVPEKTLAYTLWLSSVRKGRKRVRAPPGITSDDIAKKTTAHRGWGGKRCSGVTVAMMKAMESQGRSHEMVASRNGKTGKKGVRPPSEIKKRGRSYSSASQTTQCPEESHSEYEDANAALANPPAKKIKRTRSEFKIAQDPVPPVTFNLPTDLSQIQDIGQLITATPIAQTMASGAPLQDGTYGNQYPYIGPNLGYLESLDSIDWTKTPLVGDEDWNKENIDPALLQSSWPLPPQQISTQFTPPADYSQILEQQGWTLPHTQPRQHHQPPFPLPPAIPASKTSRRAADTLPPLMIPAPMPLSTQTPITVLAPTPKFTTAMPNLASRSLSPIPWAAPATTTHRGRQGHNHWGPQPVATYTANWYLQQSKQQNGNSEFFPTPASRPTPPQAACTPVSQAQHEAQGFDNAQAYTPQKTPGEPVVEFSGIDPFGSEFAVLEPGNGDQNLDMLLTMEQTSYLEDWFAGQGL